MFFNPMVATSVISPSGENMTVLDPKAVQRAFQDVSNESAKVEAEISTLKTQFQEIDAFTKYCAQHYPEVINEWVLTKMTKEKLGIGRKKETT